MHHWTTDFKRLMIISFGINYSTTIISTFNVSAGDYAVLIQAGLHWFTALLFNFMSSLTAVVGMFIGVAISQHTEAANEWILAVTAGLFLYIGLTDLVRMTRDKLNIMKNKKMDSKNYLIRSLVIGTDNLTCTVLEMTTDNKRQ